MLKKKIFFTQQNFLLTNTTNSTILIIILNIKQFFILKINKIDLISITNNYILLNNIKKIIIIIKCILKKIKLFFIKKLFLNNKGVKIKIKKKLKNIFSKMNKSNFIFLKTNTYFKFLTKINILVFWKNHRIDYISKFFLNFLNFSIFSKKKLITNKTTLNFKKSKKK